MRGSHSAAGATKEDGQSNEDPNSMHAILEAVSAYFLPSKKAPSGGSKAFQDIVGSQNARCIFSLELFHNCLHL